MSNRVSRLAGVGSISGYRDDHEPQSGWGKVGWGRVGLGWVVGRLTRAMKVGETFGPTFRIECFPWWS